MTVWRQAENSSVIEGKVVTGQVLPPVRYAVHAFSLLAKFIGLALFFLLRTVRPLVRVLGGLIAGFTLLACIISFAVAWYEMAEHKGLHTCACSNAAGIFR